MGRLIDIDDLKGCAIIRPTTHEEMSHVLACKSFVAHADIPTAYDIEAVVEELESASSEIFGHTKIISTNKAIEIVRRGGVK